MTLEEVRPELDPQGKHVFEEVKQTIIRKEERFADSLAAHGKRCVEEKSLAWSQMAVIPLPRLCLDSGRIERDIRGSLMQTP